MSDLPQVVADRDRCFDAVHLVDGIKPDRSTAALESGHPDVARTTGQPGDLPEDLAEGAPMLWQTRLGDRPPEGMPFGGPVPVAGNAQAVDRLAAFLGRQP